MKYKKNVLIYLTEYIEDYNQSLFNIWHIVENKLKSFKFNVVSEDSPYFFEFGRIVIPYKKNKQFGVAVYDYEEDEIKLIYDY